MKKQKAKSQISFKDSIKTKLIVVMALVAAIPLLVATIVSYESSTTKATADAQDSLEWQAWYLQDSWQKIETQNIAAMTAFAASPATITYLQDPSAGTIPDSAMLAQMKVIDDYIGDGNVTIMTSKEGQQLLRTDGNPLANAVGSDDFETAIQGVTYISNMQVSKSTGDRIVTFIVPVFDDTNGQVLGLVQRNYNLSDLHDFLASESSDAFVLDRSGTVAAHSQYDFVGADAHEEEDRSQSTIMTEGKDEGYYESDSGKGYKAMIAYVKDPISGFSIAVAAKSNEVLAEARSAAITVVIIGLILLAIAIVISFMMANTFTRPIKAISDSFKALADGRFEKVNGFEKRKDEFGAIAGDANTVIDKLDNIVGSIKTNAQTVGESSESLSEMATQISATAESVAEAVQEIAIGAVQQADEIQQAVENVNAITDAVSTVKSSTLQMQEIASKMKEASQISSDSLEGLQGSSTDMTSKIEEIAAKISATQDAVNAISEKVDGISNIASQTNLLSLNASIEAARAGEAGKGFAVVAEEIRKLADDSDLMANEIRQEMENLLAHANDAVEAANEIKTSNLDQQMSLGSTFDSVSGMIGDIENTVVGVRNISGGADTCVTSNEVVSDAMSSLSAISEQNAASSETTGASMEELSSTVTTLAESARSLKDIADALNEEMKFFK